MKTNQSASNSNFQLAHQALSDKRQWTEIQKDAGYWQRFYDYAQRDINQGNQITRGSR